VGINESAKKRFGEAVVEGRATITGGRLGGLEVGADELPLRVPIGGLFIPRTSIWGIIL